MLKGFASALAINARADQGAAAAHQLRHIALADAFVCFASKATGVLRSASNAMGQEQTLSRAARRASKEERCHDTLWLACFHFGLLCLSA